MKEGTIRKAIFNGIETPVYRCKECPFVQMGKTRYDWTCEITFKMVPLNRVHEKCPLAKLSQDSE